MSCHSNVITQANAVTQAVVVPVARVPWTMLLGGACLVTALALSLPVMADNHEHAHGGHAAGDEDEHADNPAVQAYREANERMHAGMSAEFTGDADVDFAKGMIPHHQGAIDMANIVLEHGEDEEIRQLAREVIEAQEGEIAFLEQWLEERGY